MADQKPAESVETKPSDGDRMDIDVPEPVMAKPAPASAATVPPEKPDRGTAPDANGDADADADADPDADGEVDANVEPEEAQSAERLDVDMLTIIENVANYLTAYKDDDGYHIASQFQRIPNRRLLPDYHEVIKEPIAFSTIRTKKIKKQYNSFPEFVRDVALITHNAQVYNRPSSQVFKDAVRLREVFKEELQKLVDDETITADEAVLPDLGEIPEAEDSLDEEEADGDEEEEEEDEEEEEEDEDDDDSDDGGTRRFGSRRRRAGQKPNAKDDAQISRGRPPQVLTPVEARIEAILKGLRKLKHDDGELLVFPFERLPDRTANPDYYTTIANPIALDIIKRKCKRKKYQNVDQALQDLDLMFNNAKEYNEDSSQLYKDAVRLQKHAHELAEQEKARPDHDFADEDGRRPLPEIHHKGEVWRVGDWVHITNPNDLTKPIVAQIFRTWQDRQGQQWVNANWYYRPEQTVHRVEKHFLENEVVKTGQYRDHRIDQVVDRCFVMFATRFHKGRPRGLPLDKEVYVCETRYHEDKHRFNKIKTWASCMPDEVQDKDYEMDLFDVPRMVKKVPSPIKHLIRDDAKPTDPLPKPTWGAPNAPPLIGAVHCRARESNESPPPEPTPIPTPRPVVEPIRRPSMMQVAPGRPVDSQGDFAMANTPHYPAHPAPPTPTLPHAGGYAPHFAPRPSPSPVSVPPYAAHGYPGAHAPPPMPQNAHYQPHPMPHSVPHPPHPPHPSHQPPPVYNGYPTQYGGSPVPIPPQPHHPPHQMNPMGVGGVGVPPYDPSQRLAPSPARNSIAPVPSPAAHLPTNTYNPPRPIEVYKLDEATNASIPAEVRDQFLHDEAGNVLFFTQPPLARAHRGVSKESAGLGHSVRYLADRAREVEDRRAKRKARDELRREDEKKRAAAEEAMAEKQRAERLDEATKVFTGWVDSIQQETDALEAAYDGWSVKDRDIDTVAR
ncbi:hypothetical protein F4780DRAFT_752210 [Xylariomycetidae sp. FL0641]|nr:hypothetical protein F4780DRAFT_752210 [Xylariomycetidae sp. FL0641]